MFLGVLVEEVHHTVGDQNTRRSKDDAYIVLLVLVRYFVLFAVGSDDGPASEELLVHLEVPFHCGGGYVFPVNGLSQGERYEVARDGKVSVFESSVGHTGVLFMKNILSFLWIIFATRDIPNDLRRWPSCV